MHNIPPYQKTAWFLTALILCIALGSAGYISLRLWGELAGSSEEDISGDIVPVADVYQNGVLTMSIPLSPDAEPYTFTVIGEDDGYNEIHAADGQIRILSASCPDKLCIRQGGISTSLLPIVCLPNRLVIRVRQGEEDAVPDIISY